MARTFRRVTRVTAALAALWLAGHGSALACAVCYGEAEGPMIKAASMGVYLMIGVIGAVQACFAAFFITLWRRTRQHRRSTLQADKESLPS